MVNNTGWRAVSGQSVRAVAIRTTDLLNVLAEPSVDTAAVEEVLRNHGEREVNLTQGDLDRLIRAAERVRDALAATSTDTAADRVNLLLADTAHPPRLTSHAGTTHWHVHVDSHDDAPWGEWFASSAGMALALLLTDRQRPPGGVCAARGCSRAFIDMGSGSPRRFCSRRCATRARVAAHRAGLRPSRPE